MTLVSHTNKRMKYVALIIVFLALITKAAFAQEIQSKEDLSRSIEYLLNYVAQSEVTFIRNGREYDARKASQHMQRKYKHFKDEINAPEDFIRLAGTKSIMSGKPYKVRLKNGKEALCSEWLSEALKEYRKTLHKSRDKEG
jgi:hypothetical protein